MPKTAPSFPPIETWLRMSEGEQDAVIQAVESSRRRHSWTVPVLVLAVMAAVFGSAWYYLL